MTASLPRRETSLAAALADPAGVVRLTILGSPLAQLPDEIRQLRDLEVLTLNGNGLRHLPAALFDLPKLRVLNLFNNALRALPAECAHLAPFRLSSDAASRFARAVKGVGVARLAG